MWPSAFTNRWLWLLLIVSIIFNLGVVVAVVARECAQHCGPGATKHPVCLDDTLNLTSDQRQKAAESRSILLRDVTAIQRRIDAERLRLAEQLSAPKPDRAFIQARIETLSNLQKEVQFRVVDHMLSGKEGLNPGQLHAYHQILRECVCAGCPQANGCCDTAAGEARHQKSKAIAPTDSEHSDISK